MDGTQPVDGETGAGWPTLEQAWGLLGLDFPDDLRRRTWAGARLHPCAVMEVSRYHRLGERDRIAGQLIAHAHQTSGPESARKIEERMLRWIERDDAIGRSAGHAKDGE